MSGEIWLLKRNITIALETNEIGLSTVYVERLRELFFFLFSLKKERLRRDLINDYKYKSGCQEDGTRLFSVVPSNRTRCRGHKLKHRKFCLHTRKNFFTLRVTEDWNRLPRDFVESPSLEIFKTCLDEVLCRGVGPDDPQRSLPTPTIL